MLSENAVGFRPNVYGCDKMIAESTMHLRLRHQDKNVFLCIEFQLLKRLFQFQQMQVERYGDIRKLAAKCKLRPLTPLDSYAAISTFMAASTDLSIPIDDVFTG